MKRKIYVETDRLLLGEIIPEDVEGMYTLDSDPGVHEFIGYQMVSTREESLAIIEYVRNQYRDNGIEKWAVIEKSTGRFTGWAGLKLERNEVNGHTDFYDFGYRFIKNFWGKGYATEAGLAALKYGFEVFDLDQVFADADLNNHRSLNVLQKCGLRKLEEFDDNGYACGWFGINKQEWSEAALNPTAQFRH